MKKIIVFVLVFGLFSCQKKEEKVAEKKCTSVKEKKLEMYEMSEMATLMEQMYVDNKRLKERIQKGDTIGTFPKHFLKIFTAKFTDETENDLFFKQKAKEFIAAQQLIYSDQKNAAEHFNAGVDACLKCHVSKCGGPIPRIKKLYIN
ncbi:MAG: hypothetical protein ACOYLP_08955 [Flavobacterium sp.]|uniref:hypothetical protein n=1 Tax=Flavobacterium sp. TaxID=239 RepID=UPI003BED8C86